MRINFEKERIEKWVETPMITERDTYTGQWVTSHVKFLRSGDRFRCPDRVLEIPGTAEDKPTAFLATSDPFIYIEESKENPIAALLGKTNIKVVTERFWTINVVVQ